MRCDYAVVTVPFLAALESVKKSEHIHEPYSKLSEID